MIRSWKFLFLLSWLSFLLFLYISEQNEILALRRTLPMLQNTLRDMQEENQRLTYSLEHFLNPKHLIQLSKDPAYGHLHYPSENEVVRIKPYEND